MYLKRDWYPNSDDIEDARDIDLKKIFYQMYEYGSRSVCQTLEDLEMAYMTYKRFAHILFKLEKCFFLYQLVNVYKLSYHVIYH